MHLVGTEVHIQNHLLSPPPDHWSVNALFFSNGGKIILCSHHRGCAALCDLQIKKQAEFELGGGKVRGNWGQLRGPVYSRATSLSGAKQPPTPAEFPPQGRLTSSSLPHLHISKHTGALHHLPAQSYIRVSSSSSNLSKYLSLSGIHQTSTPGIEQLFLFYLSLLQKAAVLLFRNILYQKHASIFMITFKVSYVAAFLNWFQSVPLEQVNMNIEVHNKTFNL